MFSITPRKVTPAQLRSSSAPPTRRMSHLAKILGAAAIALLATANTFANAAENPSRLGSEQHACAVVLGLDQSGRRYDACIGSLERSLSQWDYTSFVPTDRDACAQEGLHPGTAGFAVCVVKAEQPQ